MSAKLAPVRPVCDFESRVGKRHHRSPRPALLGPCEPVVASGCQRQLPRRTRNPKDEQNPAPPPLGGGVSSFWGENKTRPCATICGRLEGGVGKQHHPSLRPALLEACGPVVSETRTAAKRDGRKPTHPRRREDGRAKERQKRKNQARAGLQRLLI